MHPTGNEIHLWWADSRICPPLSETQYPRWFTHIEQQELARKIPKVRALAICAKYFLKSILSGYVDQAPSELTFRYNIYGKPSLVAEDLHFNLSHSGPYVVLAVCREVELGVDIQTMREKLDALDIAKRFFHPQEYEALKSLTVAAQRHNFYRLWSAKEAILKAFGVGIGATGLKDIVLKVLDDGDTALSMDMAASTAVFDSVSLQEFFWLPDCAFSLATVQAAQAPQVFQWTGACDLSNTKVMTLCK